jgi:hypothetical protein
MVSLFGPPTNGVELVGVAMQVTDTAGPSHSLSSLNDPALGDILSDLSLATFGDLFSVFPYAYNNAPQQYSALLSSLSAGENAVAGQPFDLLFAGGPAPPENTWLSLSFSNEVGNLDGITALNITDIGAIVPEPTSAGVLFAAALVSVGIRRHRSAR